jgi:hypothetical protein
MSKNESTKPYLYFEQIMNGIVSIPESVQNKLQNVMLVRQQELAKPSASWFGSNNEEKPLTSLFGSNNEEKPSTSVFGFNNEEKPSTSWFGFTNKEQEQPSTITEAPAPAPVPVVPMEKNTNCDIRGWSK